MLLLLFLLFAGQTVRTDNYPLRSGGCADTDKVLAKLKAGEPLQVKFGLAGAAKPCFLVTATVEGETVEGYLPGDALAGLEEFENARRAAAPAVSTGRAAAPPPRPAPSRTAAPALGEQVDDFAFVDFNGNSRRLSDFSGRYVLLDFWGSWCGPCRKEAPYLKAAYAKYRDRGFEIIGMDEDANQDAARRFVAQEGMTWTQATTPSIRDVVRNRFRIRAYPTTYLLDPQRRIIPLPPGALRGEFLLKTLDQILN